MYLLIKYISAKSAPHILSIKDGYTLRVINFLIIGICNSFANCWFDLTLLLIAPPEVLAADLFALVADVSISFYQKICKPLMQDLLISIILRIFSNIRCFIT